MRRLDVDGVPVFFGKSSGPLRAGLIFRVGQADETLPTRGLTHLVEHTALSGLGLTPHAYNGATGQTLTSFVVQAEPAVVVDHLAAVCQALSDLPVDRLTHERQVLRVEQDERQGGAQQGVWRWGARSYGLPAFPEFGVDAASDEAVHNWARSRFTRGAAALWLSGPVPDGLQLPLPDGERLPPPDPHDGLGELPGFFRGTDRGVVLSWLGQQRLAAHLVTFALHNRLTDRLRHELALVYGVPVSSSELDHRTMHNVIAAEGLQESGSRVAEESLAVLQKLLADGVTGAELGQFQELGRTSMQVKAAPGERELAHAEHALLGGTPPTSRVKAKARLAALTVEDADEHLDALASSLLLQVPDGIAVPGDLAAQLPANVHGTLLGQVHKPLPGANPGPLELVLAPTGLTARYSDGSVTILFDRCQIAFGYDEGSRRLIGDDGCTVLVAVEQWQNGPRLISQLDSYLPDRVKVPGGPRTQQPPPKQPAQWGRHLGKAAGYALLALFVIGRVASLIDDDDPVARSDGISSYDPSNDAQLEEFDERGTDADLRVAEVLPGDADTFQVEIGLAGFTRSTILTINTVRANGFSVTPVTATPALVSTEPYRTATFELTLVDCELAPAPSNTGRAPRSYLEADATLPKGDLILAVGQDVRGALANTIDKVVTASCRGTGS